MNDNLEVIAGDKDLDLVSLTKSYLFRSRTDYQLKHFVVGQHDTLEMQYQQILLEIKQLLREIQRKKTNIEITLIEIEELESTGERKNLLEAKQKRFELVFSYSDLEAEEAELNYLVKLLQQYPRFTSEDIEKNQPDYWQKRLERQANLDRLSIREGIGVGNLDALRQAELLGPLELTE